MIDPRFVELLTKELTEELTLVERQELDLLLQHNPQHTKQSIIIKEYWKNKKTGYKTSTANFNKLMDVVRLTEQSANVGTETDSQERQSGLWPFIRYAAAVLLLVPSIYLWYSSVNPANKGPFASNWQYKTTAPRMKERLTLPDGTIVTLNSATTFSYPLSFGNKTREVYLNGEAFFEVHKDPLHPFIIHTKKTNVRVLGTVFNIKSYDDASQSETSLIQGSIEVTLNDRTADRIILKPKEKLIVQNNLPKLIKLSKSGSSVNIEAAVNATQYSLTNLTYFPNTDSAALETLWLKNKLVFRNQNFESIAADMDRWYGIEIIFQHEDLKKLRFTATFEKETAVEALESFRLTEDFHFKKNGSKFYISK